MDHITSTTTSALILVHPHVSLHPGQTFLNKAHVFLAISQSFKPQIGQGRESACQTSWAAVIFHLAPSCLQVELVLLFREFLHCQAGE